MYGPLDRAIKPVAALLIVVNVNAKGVAEDGLLTNPLGTASAAPVDPYRNGLSTVYSILKSPFAVEPTDVLVKIHDHVSCCGVTMVLTGCHGPGPELFCVT